MVRNTIKHYRRLFFPHKTNKKMQRKPGMKCFGLRSPLKEDIVDHEKPDEIYFPCFSVDDFSGFFLHQSIFSIKDSISA